MTISAHGLLSGPWSSLKDHLEKAAMRAPGQYFEFPRDHEIE